MALYLTEHDVERLLTMPEAITALDDAFRRQARSEILNRPRHRLYVPNGTYHTMIAADLAGETFGIKAYTSFRPKTRFLVMLYSAQNGDILAMIEGDRLGQIRTGAATGVATRYLARKAETLRVGIFGTGWQAQTQLEAICTARPVESIVAYGRDEARRRDFCARMTEKLKVPVTPATRPEEAAEGQDVIVTATTSVEPVLKGVWLSPGTHINAVGSNMLMKREVDDETIKRSAVLVVNSIEQSKMESGDLLAPFERRLFRWEQVLELSEVVAGTKSGRTDNSQITFFKSNGLAMEDIAVATLIYHKARAEGSGVDIPMWQGATP